MHISIHKVIVLCILLPGIIGALPDHVELWFDFADSLVDWDADDWPNGIHTVRLGLQWLFRH